MFQREISIYEFVNHKIKQDVVFTIEKRSTKYTCSYSSGPIGSEVPEQSISKKECDKLMDEYRLSKDWVELVPIIIDY